MNLNGLYSLRLTDDEWQKAATKLLLPELGGEGPGRWSTFGRIIEGQFEDLSCEWVDDSGRRMTKDFPRAAPRDLHDRIASTVLTTVTRAAMWTDATRQLLGEMGAKDAIAISCVDERGGLVVVRILGTRGSQPKPNYRALVHSLGRFAALTGLDGSRQHWVAEHLPPPS